MDSFVLLLALALRWKAADRSHAICARYSNTFVAMHYNTVRCFTLHYSTVHHILFHRIALHEQPSVATQSCNSNAHG